MRRSVSFGSRRPSTASSDHRVMSGNCGVFTVILESGAKPICLLITTRFPGKAPPGFSCKSRLMVVTEQENQEISSSLEELSNNAFGI